MGFERPWLRFLPPVFLGWLLLGLVLVLTATGCEVSRAAGDDPGSQPTEAATGTPLASGGTPDLPAPSPTVSVPLYAGVSLTPPAQVSPRYRLAPGALDPLDPAERSRIERPRDALPVRDPLFSDTLWVGLYGTPAGRGLGVLGRYSPTETVELAVQQALSYQELLSGTQIAVIPFFHMVTTVADPFPGSDGDYVHRVSTETLSVWIDVASRYGLRSVLDVQPGHSPITEELAYLEPFLRMKDVHLAVDPEFLMLDGTSVPGSKIGTMNGRLLNAVQSWLNDLAGAVGVRKALIIHQFDNRMFSGKERIEDYPLVELVWDADGFGSPGSKIRDYEQYAEEPGFEYGGFKLFYNYDTPLMTPAQVLSLEPFPVFVVYQ